MTSGIPQGLALIIAHFNIFIGNIDSDIEHSFSKIAGNTTLCHAVERLEERDATHRGEVRLDRGPMQTSLSSTSASENSYTLQSQIQAQAGRRMD